MTLQPNNAVSMFDKFSLVIPPDLQYFTDKQENHRMLFITDKQEDMVISFEEDMKCLDALDCTLKDSIVIESEYCANNKYLHQLKVLSKDDKRINDIVYFHMEVPDENGEIRKCSGQMVLPSTLRQIDGVEPILKEILEGFTVINS